MSAASSAPCTNCKSSECLRNDLKANTISWAESLRTLIAEVEKETDYGVRNKALRSIESEILEVRACHNRVNDQKRVDRIRSGAGRGKHTPPKVTIKRKDNGSCVECKGESEDGYECTECGAGLCDECCIACQYCDTRWCGVCVPDYVVCKDEKCNETVCYSCADEKKKKECSSCFSELMMIEITSADAGDGDSDSDADVCGECGGCLEPDCGQCVCPEVRHCVVCKKDGNWCEEHSGECEKCGEVTCSECLDKTDCECPCDKKKKGTVSAAATIPPKRKASTKVNGQPPKKKAKTSGTAAAAAAESLTAPSSPDY